MPLPITVIIPAFNAETRLLTPLNAIARQRHAVMPAQVVVVDNASTDRTSQTAESSAAFAELRKNGVLCRTVRELSPGLTHARIRGVKEARHNVACFLDDDTEPCPDYFAIGFEAIAEERVGVVVSRVFPVFQTTPPPAVERRLHLLAINQFLGERRIDWPPGLTIAPTLGAGLWFRRDAFATAVPMNNPERLLTDRLGRNLTGSGDIEIGVLIGLQGLIRRYEPKLRLGHHIPSTRFEVTYFQRLIAGTVLGEELLRKCYSPRAHRNRDRCIAALQLLAALAATPVLLFRRDCFREIRFVLSARYYRLAAI